MKMSSETANKYFQGKENVPLAIAKRKIKTGGDMKAALALIPITKPVYSAVPRARRGRVPAPARLSAPRILSTVDSARREAYYTATRSSSGWLSIRKAPPARRRAPSTEAAGRIARRRRG